VIHVFVHTTPNTYHVTSLFPNSETYPSGIKLDDPKTADRAVINMSVGGCHAVDECTEVSMNSMASLLKTINVF
jgi:hypothetical protein